MYHWDFLVTYHWDIVGCFIWDLFETSRRRTDGTLHFLEKSSRHSIWDVPTKLLGRTERRRYDVSTTSCCRVGPEYCNAMKKFCGLSCEIFNFDGLLYWNVFVNFIETVFHWEQGAYSYVLERFVSMLSSWKKN